MLKKHIPVLLCSILFKTYFGFRSRIAVSFGMIRYTYDCVVYSIDGSGAQSGVGNFVVKSLTINWIPRSLLTFRIFLETRELFNILSVASAHKYTTQEIAAKIDFKITDSTANDCWTTTSLSIVSSNN